MPQKGFAVKPYVYRRVQRARARRGHRTPRRTKLSLGDFTLPEKELDSEANRDHVLQFIQNGDLDQAKELLWHSGGTQDWFSIMAPIVESVGDGYARSDPARAIWCYEQARNLYDAENAGATSGGEGMALLMEGRGSHLGRKIWLLKS